MATVWSFSCCGHKWNSVEFYSCITEPIGAFYQFRSKSNTTICLKLLKKLYLKVFISFYFNSNLCWTFLYKHLWYLWIYIHVEYLVDFSSASSQHDFITSSEPLTKRSEDSPLSSGEMISSSSQSPKGQLLSNWKLVVVILTPLLLLPIIFAIPDNPVSKPSWCTKLCFRRWT